MIQLNYDVELNDAMAFQKHFSATNKTMKNFRKIITLIVIGLGLFVTLTGEKDLMSIVLNLFPLVVFILIYWILSKTTSSFLTKKIMSTSENSSMYGNRTMIFTEDGIEVKNAEANTSLKWSMIKQLGETSDYFFLYISAASAYIIPKKKIAAADIEDLKILFEKKIPR
jgi:hypothetical protein